MRSNAAKCVWAQIPRIPGTNNTTPFDNMCLARDMQEMFEIVSIRAHGSFLPHGAVYKVTRDILNVSDVHAFRLSKLELLNADTKRTAERGGSRTLELRESGQARAPALKGKEGPAKKVTTKGYSTTMALSTFRKVEARQVLRRDVAEDVSMPLGRVHERVFGEGGPGRSKARSAGLCWSLVGQEYDYRCDSCLLAFARLCI